MISIVGYQSLPVVVQRSREQQSISLILQQNPNLQLPHLKQIQAQLFRRFLHQDNILITKLISICTSSGTTTYATRLFNSVAHPDLILCNSMLKAYTHNGHHCLAVHLYVQMLEWGFYPDHYTLPYVLKACAGLSDLEFGEQVHGSLVKSGSLQRRIFVANSLVYMYFKCSLSDAAMEAFRMIAEPDSTSWNIVLGELLSLGDLAQAGKFFDEMPDRDVVSWNTLISAMAKAGELEKAQALFNEMPERNLVTWNALISGFSQNGQNDEALSVFSRMLESGVVPDNVTTLTVISALAGASSPDMITIDQILNYARSSNSISVSTAVLNLYTRLRRIDDARRLFNEIPEKDLVTWNAMIGGYSQNQRPNEAVELFRQMQAECGQGCKPDAVTMVSLVTSCSQMGALGLGEWLHAFIERNAIELDVFLSTALIDMYARCGDLNRSRQLFWATPEKDLACWNAMIKGLAIHGQGSESLELFTSMEMDGPAPDDTTFVGLLSACSHGGLEAEGLELFDLMQSRYNILPQIEHYGCVVDLLGRAGWLADAYELVKHMPIEPDAVVWGALLGACRSHKNVEIAEEAARRLVELDPGHDGNYVLLSNIYASLGKWENVAKVRSEMRAHGVKKQPGCSAVELGGMVHEFTAGDRSHPRSADIYAAWDELVERIKPTGYEPDVGALLKNLDEEDKEAALYCHSEKLALSFALISSRDGSPIRIVKNLRICSDCHRAMELVSALEQREIVVRDRIRFHLFRGGHCSCGGRW